MNHSSTTCVVFFSKQVETAEKEMWNSTGESGLGLTGGCSPWASFRVWGQRITAHVCPPILTQSRMGRGHGHSLSPGHSSGCCGCWACGLLTTAVVVSSLLWGRKHGVGSMLLFQPKCSGWSFYCIYLSCRWSFSVALLETHLKTTLN